MLYDVTLELEGGRRVTVKVKATGSASAALRGRGELLRFAPLEAYTARVVTVKPAPEEEPGARKPRGRK